MNKAQRLIIVAGLVAASLLALYPPWEESIEYMGLKQGTRLGHAWVFEAPEPSRSNLTSSVDHERLYLYWAVVGFVTAALVVIAASRPSRKRPAS
jgi:hypothetical protein